MRYTLTAEWQDVTETLPIDSSNLLLAVHAAFATVGHHADKGETHWRFGKVTLRDSNGGVIAVNDPEHGVAMAPLSCGHGHVGIVTPEGTFVVSLN